MCVWLSVCIVKVGNTGFTRWSDVSAVCLHLQNCQSGILMEALPVKPKEATPMCTFTPWPCTGTPSGWATTSWCCARPTSTINCPPTPTVVNPVTRLWRGTSKWYFFLEFFSERIFLYTIKNVELLGKNPWHFIDGCVNFSKWEINWHSNAVKRKKAKIQKVLFEKEKLSLLPSVFTFPHKVSKPRLENSNLKEVLLGGKLSSSMVHFQIFKDLHFSILFQSQRRTPMVWNWTRVHPFGSRPTSLWMAQERVPWTSRTLLLWCWCQQSLW